jgi:hypothetical protein
MSEIPTSMNTDSQDTLPTLSENILGEFNDSSGFLESFKVDNEDVYIQEYVGKESFSEERFIVLNDLVFSVSELNLERLFNIKNTDEKIKKFLDIAKDEKNFKENVDNDLISRQKIDHVIYTFRLFRGLNPKDRQDAIYSLKKAKSKFDDIKEMFN